MKNSSLALAKEDAKKRKSESSNGIQDQDLAPPHPPLLNHIKKDDLESVKSEMAQVIEENKRLKSDVDRIMKDYQSLQMRFHEIAPNQEPKTNPLQAAHQTSAGNPPANVEDADPHELSLSLGRNSSLDSKNKGTELLVPQEMVKESTSGLSLALDCKSAGGANPTMQNSSTENSLDETKDEAPGETWPPSKVLKTAKSGVRDDDAVQQPPVKKARVSVRARCDTPTMNDGCQWRKYGQKIAKGNPCPRAYYRCTVAPSCPVRKQVQRCADDMSILITTYEGTHNHPLPISATAMASTTSAAAYMLISGSSTSSNIGIGPNGSPAVTASNPNFPPGLNFNVPDASRSRTLFFPNSSYSPSPSQPTITLDLTSSSASTPSASQFSKLTSSTNLTFNSLDLSNPNPNAMSWPPSSLFSQTYKQTQTSSLGPVPSTRDQESFYQALFQKTSPNPNPNLYANSEHTVAAAAKAITSDPSFQSVLTAALSSLIGANSNATGNGGTINRGGNPDAGDYSDFKWGTQSSSTSSLGQATNEGGAKGKNGCASSFLSIAPNKTTNAQAMVLSSPLPFSTSSKSTSTSPGQSRDHS